MTEELDRETAGTGASDVTRRTLAKGAAWSVPVLTFAAAAPAFAASPACVDGDVYVTPVGWSSIGDLQSNWDEQITTGWVGAFQSFPGGAATTNTSGVTDGFLSMDDNDSTSEVATVTTDAELSVIDGARYSFPVTAWVGFGNPGLWDGSARQSMVMSVTHPDGTTGEVLKLTVDHWGAGSISPSDAQMDANGYILQEQYSSATYPGSFTASGTGTATLRFVFTIQPKIGTYRTDDIAVAIPLVTTQAC